MKKALIVATVAGFVASFEYNDIKLLQSLGYEVHCAFKVTPGGNTEKKQIIYDNTIVHDIDFSRSPFSKQTLKAYKELKELMLSEHFDLVHCHTPVGGVLGRMAAHKAGVKKVIYTAHGFHFFTGAPIMNWIIYYPIEKWLSRHTDVLITINKEDYERARKKFRAKKVEYVPGVGVNLEKYEPDEEKQIKKRKELGLADSDIMILSVGELNENKNHETVIRALSSAEFDKSIHYVIAGTGDKRDELERLGKECAVKLHLLGFRTDVVELYNAADLYTLPSHREGLNVSLMEAMACGCVCMCSDIRGNRDLIEDREFRADSHRVNEWREKIEQILSLDSTAIRRGNRIKIMGFSKDEVEIKMKNIYAL